MTHWSQHLHEQYSPRATDPVILFNRSWNGKQEQHWVLCFATYQMGKDGVERMAEMHLVDPQTIKNYAKTYSLYKDLREWTWDRYDGVWKRRNVKELRELRKEVRYSNWLRVSERVYHETNPIDLETALDFLKAGADTPARTFAAMVGGKDITRVGAFRAAINGIKKALSFPMTRQEKRILRKAMKIAEKRSK